MTGDGPRSARYRPNQSAEVPNRSAEVHPRVRPTVRRTLPVAPRRLRYAGVIACAVAILYGSVTAVDDGVPRTIFGIGTTVYLHIVAYGGFTGAIGYALLAADRRALSLAVVIATLYGVCIELLQGTIPYRTMDLMDVLINATGAVGGGLLWWASAPVFGAERSDSEIQSR